MTEHEFIEAKKLIDGGMSMRKAAARIPVPYATLRRLLLRTETLQAAPEPEAEPEPYRLAMIRRHENETRTHQGLPPLTDEQWAGAKAAMEDCERQMKAFWGNIYD